MKRIIAKSALLFRQTNYLLFHYFLIIPFRHDPELPHQFQYDFKFTVFYSTEFKGLWDLFKVDAEKLLVSLTNDELKGFFLYIPFHLRAAILAR
jgi:hypothetical protein